MANRRDLLPRFPIPAFPKKVRPSEEINKSAQEEERGEQL
jgi:hypothetical protein